MAQVSATGVDESLCENTAFAVECERSVTKPLLEFDPRVCRDVVGRGVYVTSRPAPPRRLGKAKRRKSQNQCAWSKYD